MVKIDWEWINETVARRTGGRTIALPGTRGSLRVGIGEHHGGYFISYYYRQGYFLGVLF